MHGAVRGIVFQVPEELEPALGMRFGGCVERVVVYAGRRARDFAVVGLRIEVEDAQAEKIVLVTLDRNRKLSVLITFEYAC